MARGLFRWVLLSLVVLLGLGAVAVGLLPAILELAGSPELLSPDVVARLRPVVQPTLVAFALLFALVADGFRGKQRVFLPAVLSAVLLWTAFFPLNWWPVAFVALAPFLMLVRAEGIGNPRRYFAAWVGGLTFGTLAVSWLRVAHPMMAVFAWPGLSLFLSLFWPLALLLLRRLDRLGRPPLALTLPVVWVALEYAKAHFPTGYPFMQWLHLYQPSGFAWYFLGHTQHANLYLLQAADLGGAYLISAAVAAVNGAAYDVLVRVPLVRWAVNLPRGWRLPVFRTELMALAGGLLVPGGLMCYGAVRLSHPPFEVGPKVALLQDNLDQKRLMADPALLYSRYDRLCRDAARSDPDLIVWPEVCYPYGDVTVTGATPVERASNLQSLPEEWWLSLAIQETTAKQPLLDLQGLPPDTRARADLAPFRQLLVAGRRDHAAAHWHSHVLLGCEAVDWDGTEVKRYNAARLLKPDGTPGPRYDKTHLVPWGEYVPFRDRLPFLRAFSPTPDDAGCMPGDKLTRFTLPTGKKTPQGEYAVYTFGVVICYEDTEPGLARRYNPWSGEPRPADFLVNMSLDSWFDASEEHEQHLAISRFRAVEARRPLVRAVNMGISAVIDGDGRVRELPGLLDDGWSASKNVPGVIVADLPLDSRGSPYAAVGDWVPLLCWVGMACGFATLWAVRRRKRTTPQPAGRG